ncbi:MAG: cytochrome c biogenesis protein ResB [Candidatus Omnitrophica bacterium]|nr:cytochrome c biogenesis protein ResB [Candidatus Omnitrophota bacterium]
MFKAAIQSAYNFLASLKLAVLLLTGLAAALAAGTIIESAHGALAAQKVIYYSAWFNVLLLLLGVNVAASALNRLPWQKRHLGFLMTHAGILFILFGSWMTQRFAVEGILALAEGEKGDRIELAQPLLHILVPKNHESVTVPLKTTAFEWTGRRALTESGPEGLKAYLTAYYPHSEHREEMVPKAGGKPAVKVSVFNSVMKSGGWLLEGDPDRDSVHLGPALVKFAGSEFETAGASAEKGEIVLQADGKSTRFPVDDLLEKEVPVPDTAFTVTVNRYLPHAAVENNVLVNKSDAPVNPACEVTLTGNGAAEKHTVFARFPDFPTIHGLKPSQTGIKVGFEAPLAEGSSVNELRFVKKGDGSLVYQIKTQGVALPASPLETGKEYSTGWMDIRFVVESFEPEAEFRTGFEPRPMPTQGKSPRPAARVRFEKEGAAHETWFTSGSHEIFFLGGVPYHVTYGDRTSPLHFELELQDFMIDYYPGTQRPASFKSKVTLEDPVKGVSKELIISMNEPLEHRGYKVYQSGYQLREDGPEVSIFQVARDPGIPVKYAGSIIMILGIIVMFYMKRFSNSKPLYAEN